MPNHEISQDEMYRHLIDEVVTILYFPQTIKAGDIKGKGLDNFCERLSGYIGWGMTMDQKTTRSYLNGGYDEAKYNNDFFAAVWLINKEPWGKQSALLIRSPAS